VCFLCGQLCRFQSVTLMAFPGRLEIAHSQTVFRGVLH
jgi:hypothetical protein